MSFSRLRQAYVHVPRNRVGVGSFFERSNLAGISDAPTRDESLRHETPMLEELLAPKRPLPFSRNFLCETKTKSSWWAMLAYDAARAKRDAHFASPAAGNSSAFGFIKS